ncbi:MAG: type II secretion system protein GspC [Gammaproteobacteria bacterium]|nr:type II secretion system protein GspC [Gammaproteobacteria bacterium]NND54412.1 type II secretion system protein GspC [Gammaproteobacteria bacterium]
MEIAQRIEVLRGQSAAQLAAGANQWLPGVVAGLLVIVIAWHVAGLVWAVLPGTPEFDWSERVPVSSAPIAAASTNSGINFVAIADTHLFGEANAEPPPAAAVTAPETRLNLKLLGTVAANDDSIAHAIIADDKKKANVFFIEDSVPGGATLHEVFPDRVILKRGGAYETLRLPKDVKSARTSTARSSLTMPKSVSGGMPSQAARNSSPPAITEIIRPQPYMPNGQLKGYRIYPGRDRRAFSALGLRPGDLVTEINGSKLDNIQSSMDVFRTIGEVSQLTVVIERNGSPMVMQLDATQFINAPGATR